MGVLIPRAVASKWAGYEGLQSKTILPSIIAFLQKAIVDPEKPGSELAV